MALTVWMFFIFMISGFSQHEPDFKDEMIKSGERHEIPEGTKPKEVRLLINGTVPEFKNKNGYINLDVSKITDHEIVGIDLIPV